MDFGAPSAPQPSGGPAPDPAALHSVAVDIQSNLHTLATGLAHAGAAPQAVAALTGMANTIAQVVKVLGSPEAQAHQSAPAPAPAPAPMAPQGPPDQGPAPGRPATPPHAALGQAVAALHEGMQAQAQRRAEGSAS